MRLAHLLQRLKCKIGWHRPGVYGHAENHQVEIDDILEDQSYLEGQSNIEDKYNVQYEYYLCCIACDKILAWNYQYKLPQFMKHTRYIPMDMESKDEVYNQ